MTQPETDRQIADAEIRRRLDKVGVCKRYAKSRPTVNRMIADGRLPKPHYLYGRAYWWLDELESHDKANTQAYEEHAANRRERGSHV